MSTFLIKLFGFFIGLFITLFIIDYYDISRKNVETFETAPVIPSITNKPVISPIENDNSVIPYKSYKFMCINTFFDITQIDNILNRWYECDLDKKQINTLTTNEKQYFTFDKIINVKPNTINDTGAYGADLNTIELRGPKSFYFANNVDTNELTEFTILMSIKIKDITSANNIIFELAGNTEVIDGVQPKYLISIVNLNISLNKNNNYDFLITIGDIIYLGEINNIEKTTLKNNDFIIIGIIYTSTDITFILNKQIFKYKTKDNFKVKLGSTPLIINKQGLMNMCLYSFVFYKTALPSSEYQLFFKHNYHYLSGLNKVIKDKQNEIVPKEEVKDNLDVKLKELENNINDNLNKKFDTQITIPQTKIKFEEIKPLQIKSIKDTEINSPLNILF